MASHLATAHAYVAARGLQCRARFDGADVQGLGLAKWLWHASTLLPFLWYVAGGVDATPRWPVTISWTVRKGSGRLLFHAAWIAGWVLFLRPLVRHDGCGVALGVSLQMLATGVVAISLSPVGVSDAVDLRHFATSGKYMVDHVLMMVLFGVDGCYAAGFLASGVVFGASTFYLKAVKRKHGERVAADASNDRRLAQRAKLPAAARREIAAVECVEMVAEYGIFTCFIAGLPG